MLLTSEFATHSIPTLDGILRGGLDLAFTQILAPLSVVLFPCFGDVHYGVLLLGSGIGDYLTPQIRSRRQQEPQYEEKVKDTLTCV
ncbi:hypothetical protein [Parapedobacter tibetensis]|uniref:hypothetical protein n=1 Tax=Parapedobacter tibetensis TaxID=2972951 RepID=UPI00214D6875|nr:hypothetical protein [Parapedobacter tibetensis]